MLRFCDNPQEALTESLWSKAKECGYTDKPNSMTYLEISNLVKHYLKLCKEKGIDYREHDFINLVDLKLNYYENTSLIEETIGIQSESEKETQALNDLNSKLYADYGVTVTKSLKPEVQLESDNKKLSMQISNLKQSLREIEQQKEDLEEKLSQPVQPKIVVQEVPVIKEVVREVQVIKEIPVTITKEILIKFELSLSKEPEKLNSIERVKSLFSDIRWAYF